MLGASAIEFDLFLSFHYVFLELVLEIKSIAIVLNVGFFLIKVRVLQEGIRKKMYLFSAYVHNLSQPLGSLR